MSTFVWSKPYPFQEKLSCDSKEAWDKLVLEFRRSLDINMQRIETDFRELENLVEVLKEKHHQEILELLRQDEENTKATKAIFAGQQAAEKLYKENTAILVRHSVDRDKYIGDLK
jgi:hypothetical protein